MKFFVAGFGNFHRNWKLLEQVVPVADDLGFYGVLIPDHFMWDWKDMPERNSTLDAWTALSYLAAKTRKLMLGTLVTPIPFRPPGMLAKIVSTLDVISSGRAILGVGAGWSQTEFEGYSEWTDGKTRVDKTEEGVQLILKLWKETSVDFHGKFYKAKGAVLDPKPVQKPHPPLLFGGVSPRMLRLAGKYGDMCFIPPWVQRPFSQAKSIVEKEAKSAGRQHKLEYGAGSPMIRGAFNLNSLQKDIQTAADNGCQFYATPFPQDDYLSRMREFARDIMPSYNDQKRPPVQSPLM